MAKAATVAAAAGPHQLITAKDVDAVLANRLPADRPSGLGPASFQAPPATVGRNELAGAFSAAAHVHGRVLADLVERALQETRHAGRSRGRDLDDLNPTLAMKLLLGRSELSTGQAADEIKRLALLAGPPVPKSDFARVLQWAIHLRGGGRAARAK